MGDSMKTLERWMVKLVILHFLLLLLFQFICRHIPIVKDIQRITFYEGVNNHNETPIIDTWKNQDGRQN